MELNRLRLFWSDCAAAGVTPPAWRVSWTRCRSWSRLWLATLASSPRSPAKPFPDAGQSGTRTGFRSASATSGWRLTGAGFRRRCARMTTALWAVAVASWSDNRSLRR